MSSLSEQLKNLGFEQRQTEPEATESAPRSVDTSVPVRIQRQTKGRKGKGVTVVFDLPNDAERVAEYAKALRKQCGVGGSVKNGTIELQGDQREACKQFFTQQGFTAKLAGG